MLVLHTLKQYPKLCSKWGNEIKHFYENLDGLVMTKRGRGLRQRGDNPHHSNHIILITIHPIYTKFVAIEIILRIFNENMNIMWGKIV